MEDDIDDEDVSLQPYDGVEDFDDAYSPLAVVCLWAIAAVIIGLMLLFWNPG